jgi:hypothetical protein
VSGHYRLAQVLHDRIGGSQLVTFRGGYRFFLLQADRCIDATLSFLEPLDR